MVAALLLGVAAGFLSGLLGVGGGVVLVPGLIAVMAIGQREAAANSLVAIIPIAIVGAATYYLAGRGHHLRLDLALGLAAGSVGGAVAGARLSHAVPEWLLRYAFGLLLIASAARLIVPGGV